MKILYFAWIKERIGVATEEVSPPEEVGTPRELAAWLAKRGDNYAAAFEDLEVIRVAIDQQEQTLDTPLGAPSEVAFFPPVTGG
ncbi:MAG: molybdopterin converting factor subunit 1 [Pseudomonadota bacterium]